MSDVVRTAKLSDCARYRYALARTWDPTLGAALFVLLNPSTADGREDDPTVRKCIGFTRRWGLGAVWIVNLFAFRATDPKVLRRAQKEGADIVGPLNREAILANAGDAKRVIVGWGANGASWAPYAAQVALAIDKYTSTPLECLGLTDDGHPRHPLMPAYSTALTPYRCERQAS